MNTMMTLVHTIFSHCALPHLHSIRASSLHSLLAYLDTTLLVVKVQNQLATLDKLQKLIYYEHFFRNNKIVVAVLINRIKNKGN